MSGDKKQIKYKSMDQRSHVLHRPDMYIGSVTNTQVESYILNNEYKIVKKSVTTNAGLLRIFIEVLSNAIDNVWRSAELGTPCKKIKVVIDRKTGETSVWNDGYTIPVEINEQGVYNPEMIFGKLLTSSNYDDNEERKTSGLNGLGTKLTNIFSQEFKFETLDNKTLKSYVQVWKNNMENREDPTITGSKSPSTKKGFTRVSWLPDFSRFKIKSYTDDILSLMYKYVIDSAMITGVTINLNGDDVPVKSLKDYANLYYQTDEMLLIKTSDCEVIVAATNGNDFDAISFVNGIETSMGGVHVDAWTEAVFRPILEKFNGTKKGQPQINIRDVKQFFRIFLKCTLINPRFTSQEKVKLASPEVKPAITTKHINTILKWGVCEKIRDIIKGKELLTLKKTEKKKGFKKIEGYDPANNAGSKDSKDCTLILCEGLSAKTYAVLGIDVGVYGKKGRDWFGIYPLRGKILNVRNATTDSIIKNREVTDIIQALGVKHGVDYTKEENFKTLNYGKVMLLCDSDVDGLHISGLIMNFFHSLYPTLLNKEAFLINMRTPLVRIYLKNSELSFYSVEDFKRYTSKNPEHKGRVKYFKGLGTSSDKEVRNSFGKKLVEYAVDKDTDQCMNKVFHQKQTDNRKKWLENYDPDAIFLDEDTTATINTMAISDFMDYEMIKFSIDDCKRSIPSMMDGLKESHRKILYATFLKNLKYSGKTMKVAQLAGFVAEKTNYHHGEQCLFDTITKMAHDFPGSNNIPLLFRDGQFGSRSQMGKDAASARYIFTKLDMLTRLLFRDEDDVLLDRVIDDDEEVEPIQYIPILPIVLINGCVAGIGTGWSSSIPCYNPLDLIDCVKIWLNTDSKNTPTYPDIKPWYRNYTGQIEESKDKKYISYGSLVEKNASTAKIDRKVVVNEIPVGMSIDKFKEFVEELLENKDIKNYKNYSTPNNVNIEITESKDGIKCTLENLKLKTQLSTNNMVLFSSENRIKKYDTIYEIITEFCQVRYKYYISRKKHITNNLEIELKYLKNKSRFITEVMEEKLVLKKKDESLIVADLEKRKYDKKLDKESSDQEEDEKGSIKGYKYLLDMKIRSFSLQKVQELEDEIRKLEEKLDKLKKKTEKQMWLDDIEEFSQDYKKFLTKK